MANRYWVGGSGDWDASDTTHWASSSGGAGGQSVPGASDDVIFDASSGGGVVAMVYDLTIKSLTCGAFTGSLSSGAYNPTMESLACGGSGTRTFDMGSGNWTLTGNDKVILSQSPTTNMTFVAPTGSIICNYAGSTGTRIINGAGTAQKNGNIKITAGTDIVNFANSTISCVDLDFTGFSGTWSGSQNSDIRGNLTLSPTMSATYTGVVVMSLTTGTSTITSNGISLSVAMTKNNVGGTVQLADDLVITGTLTLTHGGFNDNNHNVSCGIFSSSNANARSITMGTLSLWTLTGTGTVWNVATTTNLTFTRGTATIKITDSSNTDITFAGGGLTYYNLWFARGASTATNTITGTNTFLDFKDNGSAAHTIVWPNVTTTFTSFNVNGSSGNLITLARTGGSGTFTLALSGGGRVDVNYLSISNSAASPASTWFAGINSTNGGSNTGWVFNTPFASSFFAVL
jgi:hypothetical protein